MWDPQIEFVRLVLLGIHPVDRSEIQHPSTELSMLSVGGVLYKEWRTDFGRSEDGYASTI